VAKTELGGKHQCQSCGTKFFDLNKDPITCPKCGTVFQPVALARSASRAAPARVVDEDDAPADSAVELVSLEDAEAGEEKAAVPGDDAVELEEAADDPFLEEEEEGADDVSDLIDGDIEDDDER
jgi:uncharacterized protein (TIGR02300 family)